MVSRTAAVPTTTTGTTTGAQNNSALTSTTGSSSTNTNSSGSQSTQQTNMTSTGISALDQLIQGLSGTKSDPFALVGGGKQKNSSAAANGKAETAAWKGQIDKLNQLAGDYSKSAAFKDSDTAVQGALSQALEKAMPTITAGIQAAGTSGSSMSALLTQKAAEDAAYNAAQLGVSAAISYGQIQGNALSAAGSLISGGDPAMNALISALGINKGSVSNTNSSTSSNSNSSTQSSQQTATSGSTNTAQNATQTSGLQGGTTTKDTTATASKPVGLSSSGQNYYTPSSYQSSGASAANNSYSQFQ